jgi:hypothetical protein
MKKCTLLGLMAAAMAFAPVALAQGVVDGSMNPYHVAGEKLDSGLGDIVSVGAYANPYHVAGEKSDSGLGNISAAELAPYMGSSRVAGEKLDSGLGDLTAADIAPYMNPNHVAGEKLDSGLGEIAVRSNAIIRASSY